VRETGSDGFCGHLTVIYSQLMRALTLPLLVLVKPYDRMAPQHVRLVLRLSCLTPRLTGGDHTTCTSNPGPSWLVKVVRL